jgi:hypothetical protein
MKVYIIFLTTFILFFIEALFHFSIGVEGTTHGLDPTKKHIIVDLRVIKVHIPDWQELMEIVGVLFVFSVLNAGLSSYLI